MKRLLLSLLVIHVGMIQSNVFELTQDVLTEIVYIEGEDAEGSADTIRDILTNYTIQLKALLHKGYDIDVSGPLGQTALMLAAQEANSVIATLLLEGGADVTLSDQEQFTALMHFVANWIIQEEGVWCIRSTPIARTYQSPEQCMQLLIDAGSESLELALLHVEHIRIRRSEDVQALQYEGLKRLATQIALKLNPKSIIDKIKRRIKMRRLRTA